ncbi:MAG: SpoIIE family protein phosphatase [Desulfobacteraceae bacterium]|nr:SpoIIE family protein phosphatase [Desulfobacteraceae bacterium]
MNIQETLRETERQYRNIFENAPFGIFQSSVEGHFIKVNPAMAKIFGYSSPDELIADAANIPHQLYILPPNEGRTVRKLPDQNQWTTFEQQFYKKDNIPVFIRNTVRLVQDQNGVPMYFEGFNIDITEESKQKELFHLEMSRAKELYDLILVPQLPAIRGLGIGIRYIPAEMIGGDIAELHQIDENKILIFIADITGHGIPAAMTANTLKIHFKDIAESENDPAVICSILNKTMSRLILKDDIIAAFCARIDTGSMVMSYCLCGIPTPLILRKTEKNFIETDCSASGGFRGYGHTGK